MVIFQRIVKEVAEEEILLAVPDRQQTAAFWSDTLLRMVVTWQRVFGCLYICLLRLP